MRELAYPPHITLAVFPHDPGQLDAMLDDVFASQSRLSIYFEGISYFQNDFLVLWARPRLCGTLIDLHAKLHQQIDPAICHEHYRPGQWVPHCSLATKVPMSQREAAIKWAQQNRAEFLIEFDTADFVEFPPVAVAREYRLL